MRELVGKLKADDPNIAGMSVTQAGLNVVRLRIDLKKPIEPQVFNLDPVAAYRHRLVLDLHPVNLPDPLEELISQRIKDMDESSARAARLLGIETADLGAQASPTTHWATGSPAARDTTQTTDRAQGQRGDQPRPGVCCRRRASAKRRPGSAQQARAKTPIGSSSWRWTPATAAKTRARLARPVHAKKMWC